MSEIHFGTDGWRARFDQGFTRDNVIRVADATGEVFAEQAPGSTVYVGYDTRKDAASFAALAAEVLASHGLHAVVSDSYCPTPTLCWTIAQDASACGGMMLTASHNPGEYLGIKLRMEDGGASPKEFTDLIESRLPEAPTQAHGEIELKDIVSTYLDRLRSLVDQKALRDASIKVVLDPMYGASRNYLHQLFLDLGIESIAIHDDPVTDFNGMHPEPIAPWTDECSRAVVEHGAIAGLINDGDADRIGAVDEEGAYVSAHIILCLLMEHLKAKGFPGERVIVTKSHSMLVKRQAERLGLELVVKPVGFKWIYEEMLQGDVLIGGEESGGIGIPPHVLERDGLLCALLICEMMAQQGKSLKQLVDSVQHDLGPLYYARRDLSLTPEATDAFRSMLPGYAPTSVLGQAPRSVDHVDGLRLDFEDDSWILMRPSGTEPLVRVYAEASSEEQRDALLDWGCALAQGSAS